MKHREQLCLIATGSDLRKDGLSSLCGPDPLVALAQALARSSLWLEMTGSALVVRRGPSPALAALGEFDAPDEARLSALSSQIELAKRCMRYVDYRQAEDDCRRLGEMLRERLGDDLRRYRFASLPRGGILVLGMLSYALNLSRDQLEPPSSPEQPVVVVDDCALTGSRLGSFLRRSESSNLVFAVLYSAPELRRAILDKELRVRHCLSARDLTDQWPAEAREEAEQRWQGRMAGKRYWIGQPDYVCFSWNEPDRPFWNAAEGRLEDGWRLLPPERCIKNRGPCHVPIFVQPEPCGRIRPRSEIMFVPEGDRVIVGNTETKECFCLDGSAAEMWNALLSTGDRDQAMRVLLKGYTVDELRLRADLDAFAEDLVESGILQEV